MPTLDWIGKRAVVNHHRELPYRLLHCDPNLGAGDPAAGNLVVEGDNLQSLKALLPYYAGRVKCIYIDPPYNTGNEGWVYNDNVNAPEIQKWLGDTVGKEAEDLSRHDKWLCMMYPRLALLREFLAEDGAIFISLDDNEFANARLILDEVFGGQNFIGTIIWQKKYSPQNDAEFLSTMHDYILVYARSTARWKRNLVPRTEKQDKAYKNPDKDPRGVWKPSDLTRAEHRDRDYYGIVTPSGKEVFPARGRSWSRPKDEIARLIADNRLWFGTRGDAIPSLKRFLTEVKEGVVPTTIWLREDAGDNQEAKQEIKGIFQESTFSTPKPTSLIRRILQLATNPGDLILDSFAGSGTTGHAVLALNAEAKAAHTESTEDTEKKQAADKADLFPSSVPSASSVCDPLPPRRFILCEMEPKIARDITAERLRRVIAGYGETPGLGGGFRFCTLGEPMLDADARFHPDVKWRDLGHHLWFAETGEPLERMKDEGGSKKDGGSLLGVARDGRAIYLLAGNLPGSPAGAGNALTPEALAQFAPHDGPRVVYAEACTLRTTTLTRERIVFKQIPYQVRQQ